MDFLNNIIKSVDAGGHSQLIYYLTQVAALTSVIVCAILLGKKYRQSVSKSLFIVLIVYPMAYIWMYIQYWIESGFKYFGGENFVRTIVYIPLFALLAAKILKVEWRTVCDIVAPCLPLNHCIGHLGCNFAGCCQGYACDWGIYNKIYKDYRFPNQLLESLVALAIVIFIIALAAKKHYNTKGLSFPIMMVVFGFTRFLLEFARDNNKLWLGCSALAFHALFMAAIGAVWLIVYRKKSANAQKNS